ncbi:cell wall hydrolase [Bacillus sp. UMB0899]|nr:cell wall hydrolase [Bacillus sp. UMB0899]
MVFFTYIVTNTNAEENAENQSVDSLHLILNKHGIQTETNNAQSIDLRFQQKETINKESIIKAEADDKKSKKVSKEEKKLLAQLVHAEAKGEPFGGKVAVAEVVLNRVEHEQFPDTIKQVIYQENAFEPVANNSINKPADKESYKAVQEALEVNDNSKELLYFYNPETATDDWIRSRDVVKTIGNHAFAI